MNALFASPAAIDLLTDAIAYARPCLLGGDPAGRLRTLWAAVVAAREFGADDVVHGEFLKLAHDVGLAADLGRHADVDLHHVIRWAIIDLNPFQ